jgi:hypothetical protein
MFQMSSPLGFGFLETLSLSFSTLRLRFASASRIISANLLLATERSFFSLS